MSELASILVIDDEVIMQEILSEFLREEGYAVDVAGSGEEGTEFARQRFYDTLRSRYQIDVRLPDASAEPEVANRP